MKVIVCGAGQVGFNIARHLAMEHNDVTVIDQSPDLIRRIGDTPVSGNMEGKMEIMGLPLRDAREIFEREYLMAQVTRFGGNISKTAEFIGMERSALHRKLKSLGVRNEDRQ